MNFYRETENEFSPFGKGYHLAPTHNFQSQTAPGACSPTRKAQIGRIFETASFIGSAISSLVRFGPAARSKTLEVKSSPKNSLAPSRTEAVEKQWWGPSLGSPIPFESLSAPLTDIPDTPSTKAEPVFKAYKPESLPVAELVPSSLEVVQQSVSVDLAITKSQENLAKVMEQALEDLDDNLTDRSRESTSSASGDGRNSGGNKVLIKYDEESDDDDSDIDETLFQ
mmetsp:Transcript_12552/g.23697  ORF Transcript_12552/g.23697 Transcript_12552/m.23697 type:complete len:225 (+) Transcript_12552:91-765(+)